MGHRTATAKEDDVAETRKKKKGKEKGRFGTEISLIKFILEITFLDSLWPISP